jgi:hypothetical protein
MDRVWMTTGMLAALAFAGGCGGGGAEPAAGAPQGEDNRPLPSPLPDILARVNGRPVYVKQVVPFARHELQQAWDPKAGKPAAVRKALRDYIERELLFQEALRRGLRAERRDVEYDYDHARFAYRDEKEWETHLWSQGLDVQGFKTELRVRRTVEALIEQELRSVSVSDEEARTQARLTGGDPEDQDALALARRRLLDARRAEALERLKGSVWAKARVETYL